ncbi:prolyl-tRNA editing enzyme YbaK/EbsC (Cys-tRNA(Pro) deacylase) [Sporomusaceae bacterium BoRhaA]|uniref:YbaK/EbsC family protein n=1 Tax=Pelorhabdus rhamnosifermentans TaxID=2772457 RepID=UPI001C060640|nr:YbaK/EbsC family protein [Pelorhabdus rhamnosifermentans]MBU2703635.1 prolyl-tRNA editing enzyme YbaK/EbsC (Cys-tRNA(Pro) deacylase) [Pelorhabdus rhamnosifermentans]
MAIEAVKDYFKQYGREKDILEFDESSATVELAAHALNVIPARIAKTLSFKSEKGCILVVTAGDAKVDNRKFKSEFGIKAKMLSPEEVLDLTGHAVGGVCPFGIKNEAVSVYVDVSLKRFETVFPACGSSNSAIELSCDELYQYAQGLKWSDVCKNWE